jgi:hypothetical protein
MGSIRLFQSKFIISISDGRATSGKFQSHRSHSILKPALRANNGMALDLDSESQGFANRVRRVPNGILPPSSTGNLEKDGLKNPGHGIFGSESWSNVLMQVCVRWGGIKLSSLDKCLFNILSLPHGSHLSFRLSCVSEFCKLKSLVDLLVLLSQICLLSIIECGSYLRRARVL